MEFITKHQPQPTKDFMGAMRHVVFADGSHALMSMNRGDRGTIYSYDEVAGKSFEIPPDLEDFRSDLKNIADYRAYVAEINRQEAEQQEINQRKRENDFHHQNNLSQESWKPPKPYQWLGNWFPPTKPDKSLEELIEEAKMAEPR